MVAHDLEKKERTEDVSIEDGVTFSTMLLPDAILQGLNSAGFKKPSPIQLASVPLARCGLDLIVQAKSGTGKTLVFTITALESINLGMKRVQVIILAPTREIAVQIADVIRCVGSFMKGLNVGTFVGGRPTNCDKPDLRDCQIAVGSPGRIRHLIELNILDPKAVRLFVLDEADKMFQKDHDYQHDLNYIFNSCGESKQVLALSATYPPELLEFTGKYMRDGQHVTPSGGPTPVLLGLRQMVLITRDHPDYTARLSIKEKELVHILETVSFDQCCVFLNYATRAESINNLLRKKGFSSICLTGKQEMDKRLDAMATLKSGGCRVLVATDLVARGIDASCINLVINCDVPWDAATYLHRMGRAGRYGSHGICISIISDGLELDKFRKLLGTIGGKSMYVNVIPKLRKVDLWNEDLDNFDKIQGTVDSGEEEESLENKIKRNFQTAKQYLQNNSEENIVLTDQEKKATRKSIKTETVETISLKELEEELNKYMVENVKEQKKQATPRKSTPKKIPTYSEIVTNTRSKNSPAKKSLSGSLKPKLITTLVKSVQSENEGTKVQETKELSYFSKKSTSPAKKTISDILNPIFYSNKGEKSETDSKEVNEKNVKTSVEVLVNDKVIDRMAKVVTKDIKPENSDIFVAPKPPLDNNCLDGSKGCKRKRNTSLEASIEDFDSYTYTINSNDDYETIEDDSCASGVDLNSNPEDFESLSVITTSTSRSSSEVDYPSEIFKVMEGSSISMPESNESQPSFPTDWFVVIAKEIEKYVNYSRQFMSESYRPYVGYPTNLS